MSKSLNALQTPFLPHHREQSVEQSCVTTRVPRILLLSWQMLDHMGKQSCLTLLSFVQDLFRSLRACIEHTRQSVTSYLCLHHIRPDGYCHNATAAVCHQVPHAGFDDQQGRIA